MCVGRKGAKPIWVFAAVRSKEPICKNMPSLCVLEDLIQVGKVEDAKQERFSSRV